MNTNNNTLNITAAVDRFLDDVIIAGLAIRYTGLANRVYARRAYAIDGEMAAIASEVGSHARIAPEQIEGFLVALAKAKRPGPQRLELPRIEKLSRPTEWRVGTGSAYPLAQNTGVMADWSPSAVAA